MGSFVLNRLVDAQRLDLSIVGSVDMMGEFLDGEVVLHSRGISGKFWKFQDSGFSRSVAF